MKFNVFRCAWSTAVVAVAMLGIANAQGGSQTPAAPTGQGQEVTVTGCLMQASSVTTLANMPGGSGIAGTEFVLARASMSGGNRGGAAGTTAVGTTAGSTTAGGTTPGTTAAAGTTAGGTTTGAAGAMGQASSFGRVFHLTGMDAAKLQPHVGHQVEITGHMMGGGGRGMGSGGSAGTTGGTTAGAGAGAGAAAAGAGAAGAGAGAQEPRGGGMGRGMGRVSELHATSLRMVSTTCPTTTPEQ